MLNRPKTELTFYPRQAGAYGPKTELTMHAGAAGARAAVPVLELALSAVGDPQIRAVGDPQIRRFSQLYVVAHGAGLLVMGVPR